MEYRKLNGRLDTGFAPEGEKYTLHLQKMVACRTVSEKEHYSAAEFDKFEAVLRESYPLVFEKGEIIPLCGSTFIKLPGKDSGHPLVLMSHKDVVHEGKKKWKAPPFEGRVINGRMFGRGTFDCKASLCALFEAAESLLAENYELKTDLYIFASSTEEIAGSDAPEAVEYFRKAGIVPGLVIDEGGAVLRNPFPSRYKRFAMIGAVERSSARFVFDCDSEEAAKKFKKAVLRLRPGKYEMYPEVSELLQGLSGYLSPPLGSILKVLNNHPNAAKFILTHCGPDARSFCGSLTGANIPAGDDKKALGNEYGGLKNPVRAFASGNYYNKIADVAEEIKALAERFGAKPVNETVRETEQPVSSQSAGYKFAGEVAQTVFENIGVLPYPVLGRTDSRYFIGYAEDVIRFIPVEISLSQMMKFHCPNENIFVSSLPAAVEYYREAIKQYML